MTGYLIAVVVFALPLAFGASGLGRPRLLLAAGGALAGLWILVLAVGRADDGQGGKLIPLWFLAGLVALLYAIGCGGLWIGLRLRRARSD